MTPAKGQPPSPSRMTRRRTSASVSRSIASAAHPNARAISPAGGPLSCSIPPIPPPQLSPPDARVRTSSASSSGSQKNLRRWPGVLCLVPVLLSSPKAQCPDQVRSRLLSPVTLSSDVTQVMTEPFFALATVSYACRAGSRRQCGPTWHTTTRVSYSSRLGRAGRWVQTWMSDVGCRKISGSWAERVGADTGKRANTRLCRSGSCHTDFFVTTW